VPQAPLTSVAWGPSATAGEGLPSPQQHPEWVHRGSAEHSFASGAEKLRALVGFVQLMAMSGEKTHSADRACRFWLSG